LEDVEYGCGGVLDVPGDQGVVTAELECGEYAGASGEAGEDLGGDGERAGEQDGVDVGVDELRGDGGPAVEDLEHAGGQAGEVEEAGEELGCGGGFFGGLEEDGVSGEQGGSDVSEGEVAGKVERAQDEGDAVGAVGDCAGWGGGGRAALVLGADGEGALVCHRGDFEAGFPEDLAGFAGDERCEFVGVGLEELAESGDDGSSEVGSVGPVGDGGACRGECGGDCRGGGDRAAP